jgi:RimJ/RimL family protein N-acetyltransferase
MHAPATPPVQLKTERLRLRECRPADWAPLFDYWQYESFYRYRALPIPTPEFVQSCVAQYCADRMATPRLNYWLIFAPLNADAAACSGLVSLRLTPQEPHSAELGYSVHHAEVGKGYATEAARELLTFGVQSLGVQRVCAHTAEPNSASQRVLTKLGFRCSGPVAEPKPIRGAIIPALRFELDVTDYLHPLRA